MSPAPSLRGRLTAALALAAACTPATGAYPERPIRFIVPQAAGSASDTSARIIAAEVAKFLGQQIVVDNRPGGGLTIGIDMVAKSPPDGYTLGYGNIGGLAINRAVLPKMPYDALKDLQPVAQTNFGHMLLATTPHLPIRTVRELVDHAKQNPGKLSNASSGNGTPGHVGFELFKSMAGVNIVHVPYKGGAAGMTDLIAGQVHVMLESMSSISGHARAGRLRGIAVSGATRSSTFPDLPTIAEAGVAGYEAPVWSGVIAPAGLPRPILMRINADVVKAVNSPSLREKYVVIGTEPMTGTPEEFAAFIKSEIVKWAEVARRAGAKVD